MLHLTNGQSAVDLLASSGMQGTIIPWDDALHEGPVPSGLSFDDLSTERARYIASLGWGTVEAIQQRFHTRDHELAQFTNHDEVVLWFEHDLYDQLQLVQILSWFHEQDEHSVPVRMVEPTTFIAYHKREDIPPLFEARVDVTPETISFAHRVWEAFRSSNPSGLVLLTEQGTKQLPHAGAAIQRHLQQFPSVQNGLSRTEQAILRCVSERVTTPGRLFLKAHCTYEEAEFMGDTTFASHLVSLSNAKRPAILFDDGTPLAFHPLESTMETFWKRQVKLTDFGVALLFGQQDWIDANGISRWFGGVHLCEGKPLWRWDNDTRTLTSTE